MGREQMQSIPIDDVLGRDALVVDIYLCLGPEKFVLMAKSGMPSSALLKYKEKGVTLIYVRIADYFHWIHKVIGEAQQASAGDKTTTLARVTHLQTAMESVYREMWDIGVDESVFNHVRTINHMTLSFLAKNNPLIDVMSALQTIEDHHIKNAMMVSMLSAMLGVAHGWTKPGTIEKLSLGGFLHDVGKTKLPKSISQKHESMLTKDEALIFCGHPEIGQLLLVQVKSVPDDVRLIVWEHHERADGTGYPRGLKDLQTSPLARVVALADAYTEEFETCKEASLVDKHNYAYSKVMAQRGVFNKDALKAMFKMFKDGTLKATG